MTDTSTNRTHDGEPSDLRILLTVPEACAVLRISRWMLYRLIQTRQLNTVKLGRRRLVPAAEVRALLDRLSQGTAA